VRSIEDLKSKLSSEELEALAAVAVLLRESDGVLEVLLVQRAIVTRDPWSGDMAFPGGKRSTIDSSLSVTVCRETKEETGIDLNEAEILGKMQVQFTTPNNKISVLPTIYLWKSEQKICLNYELDSYRWVNLCSLKEKRQIRVVKGSEEPVFNLGDQVVWGLTYRIIEALLDLIN